MTDKETPIGEPNPCVLNDHVPDAELEYLRQLQQKAYDSLDHQHMGRTLGNKHIDTIRPQGYPIGSLEGGFDLAAGKSFIMQEVFEQIFEQNRELARASETERLKAKYGQNFEPDFDDPKVIGRWIRKTEQDYRARWVGHK